MSVRLKHARAQLVILGTPGFLWLAVFVLCALYALLALAFGSFDPTTFVPAPTWNPVQWQFAYLSDAVSGLLPGGTYWDASLRTLVYVAIGTAGCVLVGYPVAYYIAMYARRSKAALLTLILMPFCVSYMLRMLAWVGLLGPDSYVDRFLRALHLVGDSFSFLGGHAFVVVVALIYGWVALFILPLYVSLERLDKSCLAAAHDLGAGPLARFWHVTLPLSRQGVLAGVVLVALPMFGDYYTNQLVSGAASTTMIGNVITANVQSDSLASLGAAQAVVLFVFLAILLALYVRSVAAATREVTQ